MRLEYYEICKQMTNIIFTCYPKHWNPRFRFVSKIKKFYHDAQLAIDSRFIQFNERAGCIYLIYNLR
jgi:hypothetical protein